MCGLCLPHCPTYKLNLNESESPRGRINVMRVLIETDEQANWAQLQHLDNCLNCLACESMCPSQVPYAALIDHTRQRLNDTHQLKRSAHIRLINALSTSRTGTFWLSLGTRILQNNGVRSLLNKTGLAALLGLQTALRTLPPRADEFAPTPPSPTTGKKTVSLLTGCADKTWSGRTLNSAITLLEACGYQVKTPLEQGCCGALDLHEGRASKAIACHARNQTAFTADAVVSVSTACSAHLQEHTDLNATDICDFLLDDPEFLRLSFKPLKQIVSIHTACSQKNSLHSAESNKRLLALIPGLESQPLADHYGCCGAAGTHFLRNPTAAHSLRKPMLEETLRQDPTILVSANIGCRLHLAAGLRELASNIEVIHPIDLLARQLRTIGDPS